MRAAVVAALMFVALNAQAETDYARLAKITVSAFECSHLGSVAKINEDQLHRLFNLGVKSGRAFLHAVREGKITTEQIHEKVPLIWSTTAQGPTDEFKLGRLYEDVTSLAEKAIKAETLDGRRSNAVAEYHQRNCTLLK